MNYKKKYKNNFFNYLKKKFFLNLKIFFIKFKI